MQNIKKHVEVLRLLYAHHELFRTEKGCVTKKDILGALQFFIDWGDEVKSKEEFKVLDGVCILQWERQMKRIVKDALIETLEKIESDKLRRYSPIP